MTHGDTTDRTRIQTDTLMKGFIVSNYQNRFGEAFQQMTKWVKEGKV